MFDTSEGRPACAEFSFALCTELTPCEIGEDCGVDEACIIDTCCDEINPPSGYCVSYCGPH